MKKENLFDYNMLSHFILKLQSKLLLLLLLFCTFFTAFAQDTIIATTQTRKDLSKKNGLDSLILLNNLLVQYTDSNNYEVVQYLLERGADPDATYEDGDVTPLMYASQNGNYRIAKLLIEKGADVNRAPWDGNTPLFAAVRSGNDSIAELLLEHNANPNLQNTNGLTPLHYAVGFGYPFITEILLYYGANPDTLDPVGNSPLMIAAFSGAQNCAKILIENSVNPNQPDKIGNTPLMVAAQFNDTSLIKTLIRGGADITLKNKRNCDAISFAINNGSSDALRKLLEYADSLNIDLRSKNQYYQQSRESGYGKSSEILTAYGYKTKVKPSINSINFFSGIDFSYNDFMYDFGGGINEPVSKTMVNLGFKFRPFSSRVNELRDMEYYQFWEKRYSFYLSANYLNRVYSNSNSNFGITMGLNLEYSWSNYRGTELDRGGMVLLVPNAGLFYKREFFMINAKWLLANYKTMDLDINRFAIQLIFTTPTNKNRVINKKIRWLD